MNVRNLKGSKLLGGVINKAGTQSRACFCLFFSLSGLNRQDIMICDVSRACLHAAGGCPQGKLAIWPELCDGQMNEYIFKIVFLLGFCEKNETIYPFWWMLDGCKHFLQGAQKRRATFVYFDAAQKWANESAQRVYFVKSEKICIWKFRDGILQ